jgi:hypothetical protein
MSIRLLIICLKYAALVFVLFPLSYLPELAPLTEHRTQGHLQFVRVTCILGIKVFCIIRALQEYFRKPN